MVDTGSDGDEWPEANLAHITVSQPGSAAAVRLLNVRPVGRAMLSPHGLLGAPVTASFACVPAPLALRDAQQLVKGQSGPSPAVRLNAQQVVEMQHKLKELSNPVASIASPTCSALPAGHRRRIFFGVPASNPDAFGLGYEEVDADGNPVPGTFEDIAQFDPDKVNVCLPLAAGNKPVTEDWELVNVAAEAHNFHMHQTKFYVHPENAPEGDGGAMMDNVPLPNGGNGCDGSVDAWRDGECKVATVRVSIPFAEVGDFVYHCHIGEHQDGGMMAHIRVIASQ
jgi:hypothetical protein